MRTNASVIRWLAWIGLLGAVALIGVEIFLPTTFGEPGSAEYQIYERHNRVASGLFAPASLGFMVLYLHYLPRMGSAWKIALAMTMIGFAGMILGNILEFWVFTTTPYEPGSPRNTAWGLFSLASLLPLIGCVVGGIALLRAGVSPRWVGLTLIALLPGVVALYFAGMLFLPFAIPSAAFSFALLRQAGSEGRSAV